MPALQGWTPCPQPISEPAARTTSLLSRQAASLGGGSCTSAPQPIQARASGVVASLQRDGGATASTSGRDAGPTMSIAGRVWRSGIGLSGLGRAQGSGQGPRPSIRSRSLQASCSAANTAASSRLRVEDLGLSAGEDPSSALDASTSAHTMAGPTRRNSTGPVNSVLTPQLQHHTRAAKPARASAATGRNSSANGHAVWEGQQDTSAFTASRSSSHRVSAAAAATTAGAQEREGLLADHSLGLDTTGAAAASLLQELSSGMAWAGDAGSEAAAHAEQASSADSQALQAPDSHAPGSSTAPAYQFPGLSADEQQARDKAVTRTLNACTCLQDITGLLHTIREQWVEAASSSSGGTLSPAAAAAAAPPPMQLLNPRHVAVLWGVLARVVMDTGSGGEDVASSGLTSSSGNSMASLSSMSSLSSMDSGDEATPAQGQSSSGAAARSRHIGRAERLLLQRLLGQLEQRTVRCMAESAWSARDLANAAWAVAKLQYAPSKRWLPAFVEASLPLIADMEGRHLSMALWGLATSELHPGQAWLTAAQAHALQLATAGSQAGRQGQGSQHQEQWALGPQGLALVLWGVAHLQQLGASSSGSEAEAVQGRGRGQGPVGSLQDVQEEQEEEGQEEEEAGSDGSASAASWGDDGSQAGRHGPAEATTRGSLGRNASAGISLGSQSDCAEVRAWLAQMLPHAARALPLAESRHVAMMVWALGALSNPSQSAQYDEAGDVTDEEESAAGAQAGGQAAAGGSGQAGTGRGLLEDPRTAKPVAALLQEAAERGAQQQLGPLGTANALWAAARLGVDLSKGSGLRGSGGARSPAVTAAAESAAALVDQSQALLGSMSAQQLANCTWALASMRAAPDATWVRALLQAARARMPDLEPQGAACLLWGCAKLGVRPGLAWMAALMEVTQERMGAFCSRSLPMLLSALARLGYTPGQAWAKACLATSSRSLRSCSPHTLATLVAALAKLSIPPQPSWCSTYLATVRQHMDGALALSQPGAAGGAASAAGSGSPMQARELAAILQGVARLGMQPSALWLETAEDLLLLGLSQLSQPGSATGPVVLTGLGLRQLSGCLYGLARTRHAACEPLLDLAAASLVSMGEEALSQLSQPCNSQPASWAALALDVAQGTWALAMLGYDPAGGPHLSRLSQLVTALLPHMGHAELAQSTWALQRMGWVPCDAWLQQLTGASEPLLPSMPLLSVATLVRALAFWCAPAASPLVPIPATSDDASNSLQGPAVPAAAAAAAANSSGSGQIVAAPVARGPVVSQAWLSAAAAAVDRGARLVVIQPHDSDFDGSTSDAEQAAWAAGVSASDRSIRASPGPGQAAAAAAAEPLPFAAVAARNAVLSAAGATMGKQSARRRLAQVERLPNRQRLKVAEAARRALTQLEANSSTAAAAQATTTGVANSSQAAGRLGQGEPRSILRSPSLLHGGADVEGQSGGSSTRSRQSRGLQRPGLDGQQQDNMNRAGPGKQSYDGLYAEHDLRYMPW